MAVITVVTAVGGLTEFIYFETLIISITNHEEFTLCNNNPYHRSCSNYCACGANLSTEHDYCVLTCNRCNCETAQELG